MAAVIYARISKDDAGEKLGVDRQERLCRELADREGIHVDEVLVDNDLSAYGRRARPGFERLVELMRGRQVDHVVTYHADRLYRRTTDLERLVEIVETTGAQVRTVAAGTVDLTTASGRMVARMLGAAAQHESERLGERVKAKHDELAAAGKHPGGRPPYGYGRGYVIEPREAAIVRRMAARVLDGASLLRVARELEADGIPTREGGPWHHSTVRSALVNPAVAGLRVHRREIAGPGTWESVLDRATWEELRAVLADPARKRKKPPRKYLLAGLVVSSKGDPMNGRPDRNGAGGAERRTYATRSPAQQPGSVDADELEATITEVVLAALDESEIPSLDVPTPAGDDIAALERELTDLADLRGKGIITLAEWLTARAGVQERLDAARAAHTSRAVDPSVERLVRDPGAARQAWPELDLENRRALIGLLIERVVVAPATRGRWTTLEERLDPANGGGIRWKA